MTSKLTSFLFLFICFISSAQTLKGKVVDAKTNAPLEMVSVYFDNTTIGTTTNENGAFSIDYNDAVQSTLVISFLGYDKYYMSDYRNQNDIVIKLKESLEQLDEVVITTDDGMSRAEKLRWFRKEFLGKSENGKSCKILNEKDLRFRYNKRTRTLTAWSNSPVLIKNRNLQYEISFDIEDFEIVLGNWNAQSVIYTGTTFYKDLNTSNKKRFIKNRKRAYEGSIQHFMRALYNQRLTEEGYVFGLKGFVVMPNDYFSILSVDKNGYKKVNLKQKVDVFYKSFFESTIQTDYSKEFAVDKFGNYDAIQNVLFGGDMGSQRVGDTLPLDYALK